MTKTDPAIRPARSNALRGVGSSVERRKALAGFLFAVPAILLFGLFAIYPMLRTAYLSFFEYNLLNPPDFIGLDNYTSLVQDPTFWNSVTTTIVYIVGTYAPAIVLALGLALLLNRKIRFRSGMRALYFTPFVLSMVVVAVIWRQIFFFQGPLNAVLGFVGIDPIQWLNDPFWAQVALILISIWRNAGFLMVLFLAGLQGIPDVYREAARIDGAGIWQQFWYVTLPMLTPTTVFVVTMSILLGLQEFAAPFVLTGGGPAGATTLLSLYTYQTAFSFQEMGRATAVSMLFFIMLVIVTLLQRRRLTAIQG